MSWVFGQAQGKQPIRTYGSKKAVAPSTTRPATGLSSFRSAAGDMGIQVHANSPGLDDSMGSPLLTAPTKRPGALGDLDHNLLDPHGEARRNGPKRKKSSEPAGLETQLKKFHKMATPEPISRISTSPVNSSSAARVPQRGSKKQSLRDVLGGAHTADLTLLKQCMGSRGATNAVFGRFEGLVVHQPSGSNWMVSDLQRLNLWLESLGFTQDWRGDRLVYVLATESLSELKRGLSHFGGANGTGTGTGGLSASLDLSFGAAPGTASRAHGGAVVQTPMPGGGGGMGLNFSDTYPPSSTKHSGAGSGMHGHPVPVLAGGMGLSLQTRFPPRVVKDSDPYADSPSTASEPPTPLNGMDSPFFNETPGGGGGSALYHSEDVEIRAGLDSLALANAAARGGSPSPLAMRSTRCTRSGRANMAAPTATSAPDPAASGGGLDPEEEAEAEDRFDTHPKMCSIGKALAPFEMRRGSREGPGQARARVSSLGSFDDDMDIMGGADCEEDTPGTLGLGNISRMSCLLDVGDEDAHRHRSSSDDGAGTRPRLTSCSSVSSIGSMESQSSTVRMMSEMTIPQSPVITSHSKATAAPHSGADVGGARLSNGFPCLPGSGSSGGREGREVGKHARLRKARTVRRSISESGAKALHVPSSSDAGHITPGGLVRTGGEFRTPQSQRRTLKVSGKGDMDWGTSMAAPFTGIREWKKGFLALPSGDLGPPVAQHNSAAGGTRLVRSHTTGGMADPLQGWTGAALGAAGSSLGSSKPSKLPMPMRLGLALPARPADTEDGRLRLAEGPAVAVAGARPHSPGERGGGFAVDMPAPPGFRTCVSLDPFGSFPSTLGTGTGGGGERGGVKTPPTVTHPTHIMGSGSGDDGGCDDDDDRRGSGSRLSADARPWEPPREPPLTLNASASILRRLGSPLRPCSSEGNIVAGTDRSLAMGWGNPGGGGSLMNLTQAGDKARNALSSLLKEVAPAASMGGGGELELAAPPSAEQQARSHRRKQRSRSKHRRMSLSLKQCSLMNLGAAQSQPPASANVDTEADGGESEAGVSGDIDMMSPSAKPKPRSHKSIGFAVAAKATRRLSAGGSWAMGGMSMASSPDVSACIDSIDGASFRQLTPDNLDGLDERTFKGTIVGATYQQRFDDCPLVAPPGSSDARVVGVRMLHGGSDLELTVRRSRTRGAPQTVTLGDQWRWLRAEPDGYLVTAEAQLLPNKRCVLYWLPRHPVDWAQEGVHSPDAGVHSPPPNASRHAAARRGDQGGTTFAYEPSPSPSQRVMWTPGDVGLSGHAVMHPDMDEDGFSKGQASPIPIGMDFGASSAGHGDGLTMTVGVTGRPSLVPVGMSPPAHADSSGNGNAVGATMDWNNSSIAALVLEFLLGDEPLSATTAAKDAKGAQTRRARRGGRRYEQTTLEETVSYRLVSKAWAVASYKLLAKHLSTLEDTDSTLVHYTKWSAFMRARPWGRFLSSGACKEVFCVQDEAGTRQAVSVMDVTDLRKRDMDAAVGRELEISMLCSALYSLNICPNTLCIHSLFRAEYGVAPKLWAPNRKLPVPHKTTGALPAPPSIPQKRTLTAGCHQFIRMEFCRAGDLEEVVRREQYLLPTDIQMLVFQMCFAMYACREQLQLRHHDVKLLNFFATDATALRSGRALPATTPPAASAVGGGDFTDNALRIGFGAHVYALPLGSSDFSVAKLADFGTSVVGAGSLGDPIMLQHFTTLENTPPEFLLLGSRARQAFSSDTFPLGLAVLHLLTGLEPYEELLGDVHCPAELCQALAQLWLHGAPDDDYHVIRRVVDTLELEPMYGEGEVDTGGAVGAVLYDTLYRYLVLFEASGLDCPDPSSPVGRSRAWRVCSEILGLGDMNTTDDAPSSDTARATAAAAAAFGAWDQDDADGDFAMGMGADGNPAVLQFRTDRALWSLRSGTHAVVKDARERLEAVGPGMSRLLRKMCHFDPSRRCTMHEVLSNAAFASLREVDDNALSGGCGSLRRGNVEDVMAMDETSPMPVACLGDRFGLGLGAGDGDGDISDEVELTADGAEEGAPLDFMHYFRPAIDGGSTCLPMV